MKTRVLLYFLIFTLSCFFVQGCASAKKNGSAPAEDRVYSGSYDEVWDALYYVIFDDLKCAPQKVKKKRGRIETEWVYRIDTEGIIRWKIRAKIKAIKNGVRVFIDRDVQLRDEVSRNINKYRDESKAKSEPRAGWRRGDADIGSLSDLYLKIDNRLKLEKEKTD